MNTWGKTLLTLGFLALLQGCETQRVAQTIDRIDKNAIKAGAIAKELREGEISRTRKNGKFTDSQWVNTTPMDIKPTLPDEFNCNLLFNRDMGIYQFAQVVSDECRISVKVKPDVFDRGAGNRRGGNVQQSQQSEPAQQPMLADYYPGTQQGNTISSGSGAGSTRVSGIEYKGRLAGLLDQVTTQLGISWRYNPNDRSISIFYLDTRTFNFYAFADTNAQTSVVQSGTTTTAGTSGGTTSGGTANGGVSGLSGSNQSTSVTLSTSLVDDVEKNVGAMLSPVGNMAMSKSTGMLTVTDRPDVLDRIATYIDAENKNVTQQILLNVEVYSVTLKDSDALSIDWDLVYAASNGRWNLGLGNAFDGTPSRAVSGSVGILDGSWAGSKAVVKALSEQGNVSIVTNPSVTTLNLQPVPVLVGRQTTYLASVQTTNTADVGSTSALTPGSVTSGFNMDLLPFVLPGDELLLKYSISISSLIDIRQETSGDNRIEMPEVDSRIFSQKVRLKSGETLVLSGFDQVSEKGNRAGTGAVWNLFFGGGATRETTRDVIVVMITPIIKG